MKTAIIYNNGVGNYQSNGGGYDIENTIKNFREAMESKGAIWAHQFNEETGEYVSSYFKNEYKYDPNFGDQKLCKCGDPYYRHFDPYENWEPVGCKYCGCLTFEEAK